MTIDWLNYKGESGRCTVSLTLNHQRSFYLDAMRESHQTIEPALYGGVTLLVSPSQILFDVKDRVTARLWGGLSLHLIDESERLWELGYWILPDQRGKGLTEEAAALLIQDLFASASPSRQRAARKLIVRCDERNRPSLALARKLGFKPDAELSVVDPKSGQLVKKFILAIYA